MNRYLLSLLPALFFTMFFPFLSFADTLSPGVQAVLRGASAEQEIPVIINLSTKADLSQIKETNKEVRRNKIIKALQDEANSTQGFLKALLRGRGAKRMMTFWVTNSIAATVTPAVISELTSFPGINSIELDAVIPAPVMIPAAAATPEWNISRIKAPALWSAGVTGAGTVVANMDSGVDINHPDVQSGWLGGPYGWYNPYADPLNAAICGTPDQCTFCELSGSTPCDDTGHGTGTMGVMVGGSAGGTAIGVAPDAKWIAVKIFPSPPARGALSSTILQGFQWLLGLPGGSAPGVVNNSWGEAPNICDNFFLGAINSLKTAGIEVVFSAGNSGPFSSTSEGPANNPGAFAVGATDVNNAIAFFSSRGPSACDGSFFPHVVAPGVDIKLAGLTAGGVFPNTYVYDSGTSFAVPHVAGAAALLMSAFPALTPPQIETALEQTAFHLMGASPDNTVPNNTYGYGLADVSGALSYIASHGNIAIPEIAGYPASYGYGNVPIDAMPMSRTFTLTNKGTTDLLINAAPNGLTLTGADAADFSVTEDTCSGQTLASFASCTVSVVLAPLAVGAKSAQLSINYGVPSVVLDVPLSGYVVDRVIRLQGASTVSTYATIQAAFYDCSNNICADGEIIAAREGTFVDSLNFAPPLNIAMELLGGYDPSFVSHAGFTTVNGTLTISNGTLTVGNIILQ